MNKNAGAPALFLAAIFSLLSSAAPSAFAATSLMEEKLLFEKAIQDRAEKIVEKITGSKEMVVLTTVELAYEETKKDGERDAFAGARRAEEDYLPGITYSYVPFDTYSMGQQNVIIKRITVLITLPVEIQEAMAERVRKETNELLGLNPLRGDSVQVTKIAFSRETKKIREYIEDYSRHLYWLFLMGLLTLFLFGPVRQFFKTVVKAVEIKIEADTRIRGGAELMGAGAGQGGQPFGGGSMELVLDRKRPQLKEGDQTSMKRFGFINDANLKNLIYLIKKEPVEEIAVVISYLPQSMASQILTSLPPATQAKVAMNLATVKILNPSDVDAIEKNLKTKIDYLLGGEDNFMQILDSVDRETQENILKTLETENPTLAVKLKSQLFFFEDLVLLDKTSLLKVIRESQRRQISLALALKSTPEEIKVKIMDALTEGARAMLAEQIDLLGEVSEKRTQEERKMIETVVKELEKNGDIVIDRSKKDKGEGYDIVTRK